MVRQLFRLLKKLSFCQSVALKEMISNRDFLVYTKNLPVSLRIQADLNCRLKNHNHLRLQDMREHINSQPSKNLSPIALKFTLMKLEGCQSDS